MTDTVPTAVAPPPSNVPPPSEGGPPLDELRARMHQARQDAKTGASGEPAPAEPPPVAPVAEPAPAEPAVSTLIVQPVTPTPTAPAAPAPVAPTVEELQQKLLALEAKLGQPTVAPSAPTAPAVSEPIAQEPYLPQDEAELAQVVQSYSRHDPESRRLQDAYFADKEALSKIEVRDPSGVIVGGQLYEIDRQIDAISLLTDPERRKALGVEIAQPDELQVHEARAKLAELRILKSDLQSRAREIRERNDDRARQYDARRNSFESYIRGQIEERQDARNTETEINQHADIFEREFKTAFDAEFAKYQIPAQYRDKVLKRVKQAAWAADAREDPALDNTAAFVSAAVKEEAGDLDAYHRAQSAVYNQRKVGDSAPASPTTPAAAAIPPSAARATGDWSTDLRAKFRAMRANVRTAYGR